MANRAFKIEEAAQNNIAVSAMLGYLARSADDGNKLDLIGTNALLEMLAEKLADTAATLENLAGGGSED